MPEAKRVEDRRLFAHLTYPGGYQERFKWQFRSPESIAAVATPLGLCLMGRSSDFVDSVVCSSSKPRTQIVPELRVMQFPREKFK